ncbi:hypothetical protein GM3708_829 [Geminocystis sp. NIES-3708]|uniref:hypothetical protein n=1 Tax=Geminocystis sp. NIES-3708 TaxID=1615909 RepID=UPI0005FC60EF|nr:hypothetical protein [Geminocystis sp. NIES-3708]BAQ60423.1 hypothetical protein GM3708_829 [Geminocystis sp. NIES-3708]
MFKSFVISSLILATANLTIMPTIVQAQNPPAETFQPGFWQPIARVDITKPITLKIINDSGISLDYALTDSTLEPSSIPIDATETLKNFQPPSYIVIYPDIKNPDASRINLKYSVNVTSDNTIELRVTQIDSISQGNRTFNLQKTGAIFVF